MPSQEYDNVFHPPENLQQNAHCRSLEQYRAMYEQSINDPAAFWTLITSEFTWKVKPQLENFVQYNFDVNKGKIFIKWMEGAVTNICYNVLDRNVHEKGFGEKVAFYWEGNDPCDEEKITYADLLRRVCHFANVLKSKGIVKGSRVALYLPMVPEIVVAMLACARIGAVHSIVFGGFSAKALADRILDGRCDLLVTADGAWRGTKLLNLKDIADEALSEVLAQGHEVKSCIVVNHLGSADADKANGASDKQQAVPGSRPHPIKVTMKEGRDSWWHDELTHVTSVECEPEWLGVEEPLFMLYTSGSTGRPKGVLHTCGGYLLHVATSFKYVFDHQANDVYWCTADIGWITGHSYVTYGPMANGATSILFEGTPFHPDVSRFWAVVDKYHVSKFYTAPTAIRSLMKFGDEPVKRYDLTSLKVLGTVGEPINPEAWLWYHHVVGHDNCAVVDTFWQTETGGHTITPLPGATPTKPGSATFPFFGVVPHLLNENGSLVEGEGEGYLVFSQPWPGMMRTVFGDHERFESTYFSKFPGYYCTGDGARRDKDGYLWITGRIDDMLNSSGHLLSTAEVEAALNEHPDVAESAVVAHPHEVKGECLYCFITVKEGKTFTERLVEDLKKLVRQKIGPFAQPDFLQEAPALPKTRSGKIMRRILRKIAVGDHDIGDTTTLADESVVEQLFKLRPTNA